MKAQTAYIPSLDGIRAVSILLVILAHSGFEHFIPGGFGVAVFFFLSGFLITHLLVKEYNQRNTIHIRHFFLRRFCRLFPPQLISLAIAYMLTIFGILPGKAELSAFLAQLLYFANYYALFFQGQSQMPQGTQVLWSLAVEEHFYLIYPLLMLALFVRIHVRKTGYVLVCICIAVLLWRFYLALMPLFNANRTYYATDTRIDSILFGCILAVWRNPVYALTDSPYLHRRDYVLLIMASVVALSTFLYRDPLFRETIRYTVQGIALMPIFYIAIKYHRSWIFGWLNSSIMRTLGLYSYAMYLSHYVVIHLLWANGMDNANPLLIFILTLGISTVYAFLIDKYVDQYFRRIRRGFHGGGGVQFKGVLQYEKS